MRRVAGVSGKNKKSGRKITAFLKQFQEKGRNGFPSGFAQKQTDRAALRFHEKPNRSSGNGKKDDVTRQFRKPWNIGGRDSETGDSGGGPEKGAGAVLWIVPAFFRSRQFQSRTTVFAALRDDAP
jgi:hypothetical protein